MYSEVYVRYVFGFVLIISLRLDRRRQRSFSPVKAGSWKASQLHEGVGAREGTERQSRCRLDSPVSPRFQASAATSRQTPARPLGWPPVGRTPAPQRCRRCSPCPGLDTTGCERVRNEGGKTGMKMKRKVRTDLWRGGPPPLDICRRPTTSA